MLGIKLIDFGNNRVIKESLDCLGEIVGGFIVENFQGINKFQYFLFIIGMHCKIFENIIEQIRAFPQSDKLDCDMFDFVIVLPCSIILQDLNEPKFEFLNKLEEQKPIANKSPLGDSLKDNIGET